jgi:hypothetical protein
LLNTACFVFASQGRLLASIVPAIAFGSGTGFDIIAPGFNIKVPELIVMLPAALELILPAAIASPESVTSAALNLHELILVGFSHAKTCVTVKFSCKNSGTGNTSSPVISIGCCPGKNTNIKRSSGSINHPNRVPCFRQ